ncbi:acyl-CoA dehydrogenase family protein [Motiliproteus sp. MSK22-1]|uniref:acyl-CoA dehydrogenase family protein n=1 Tax=Motiliproteus sp. MSK22-1 TaxID=1897630 RepID=UPI0009767C8A|nr:acyl-CoA dehydrogenase family protein [Motiliproteus sp. MSK22-1]OMH38005.1 acyl-CoA dehydrogenase [Motiliproteus sp. MSK22-1]
MAEYRAPLKDMNFVLQQLVGMDDISTLPGYEEATPDMVSAILEEAAKLAGEVLSPLNVIGDQQGVALNENGDVPTPEGYKEAYQQFVEGGWGSLQFDPDQGGQGMPLVLSTPVMEMWQSANLSWGLCPLLTQGAIEALDANASAELKNRYIPKMVSGEWTGSMNLTEPQAGSDLAAIRSRAEPEGDHYRIKGQKIFITWGEHDMAENIIHLVLARLPDAPPGVRGISLFVVPKYLVNKDGSLAEKNDCGAVSLEHKMGIHSSPTCVMSFGDQQGAVGYLVGEPHKGLACMFTMMNNARLGVGLQGVSLSERAYQLAVDYARDRVQCPAPGDKEASKIIRHPDVRRMLMTMRTLTEAGRALTYSAYGSLDYQHRGTAEQQAYHQARVALLTPIVKGWCTEVAQEVTSLGVQVHGGMGFIEETGAAQYYRDARILTIYEGTSGIQAQDLVGRKTLFDQGAAMDCLLNEMLESVEIAQQGSERLKAIAGELLSAIESMGQTQAFLLKGAKDDINLAGSLSFNYMMLAGTVCGGWQMLCGASAAERLLQQSGADTDFCDAKLATAEFYMEQVLPRYLSYAAAATGGSRSIMAMDESLF